MKQSIWFVFGILHFICQKTADFAKNEMQKFGKNMSEFGFSPKWAQNVPKIDFFQK